MRRVIITLGFLLSIVGAAMAAEGPGGSYVKPAEAYGLFPALTPIMQLRGTTDSNGNLNITNTSLGSGQTPLTTIATLPGRTDSSGNLFVNCQSGCGAVMTALTTQISWTTGLGAITHILGPADQSLKIFAGASQTLQIGPNASSGMIVFGSGPNFDPTTNNVGTLGEAAQHWNIVWSTTFSTSGTTAVAVNNVGANSCGTTAATIAGNENVGAITVGATSGTQCRITFTLAATNRRHCAFNDETTAIALRSTYVDTTHTDVLGGLVAGDVVSYVCMAR